METKLIRKEIHWPNDEAMILSKMVRKEVIDLEQALQHKTILCGIADRGVDKLTDVVNS